MLRKSSYDQQLSQEVHKKGAAGNKEWYRLAGTGIPSDLQDRISFDPRKSFEGLKDVYGNPVKPKKNWTWEKPDNAAVTVSGCIESHTGGQKIGKKTQGLSNQDIEQLQLVLENQGYKTVKFELPLDDGKFAFVLYIKRFCDKELSNEIFQEILTLPVDCIDRHIQDRAGRIKNKNSRWNYNAHDRSQSRDPEVYLQYKHAEEECKQKVDRGENPPPLPPLITSTVSFTKLPAHNELRRRVAELLKDALPDRVDLDQKDLGGEGNLYWSKLDSNIGPHGDGERNLVFGVSFGTVNRIIQWIPYTNSTAKPNNSEMIPIYNMCLNPGDAYVMTTLAAGTNWLKDKRKTTYRHRAGPLNYLATAKIKTLSGPKVTQDKSGKAKSPFVIIDITKKDGFESVSISEKEISGDFNGDIGDGAAALHQASSCRRSTTG